ncbi:MAG: DUF1501 domain-containing protein, partial [Capsulimonadales bacterium]|nr:DUF1501 domain-containing protein [Capsulimonadales bacterium]
MFFELPPCGRVRRPLSRRELLARAANGFGGLSLLALLSEEARAADGRPPVPGLTGLHHPARAKAVIFLYMDGGPSQMDTFDPKPRLAQDHGKTPPFAVPATQFNNNGLILKSPWEFRQYGQSGLPVSELFPHVATCADDLCVIRSMTSNFSEHTNANYFLHTGSGQQGRPSMGAWITYGLGSESRNLPGFVVLNGGLTPPGGADCFGSGFLPPDFQGSVFQKGPVPIPNLSRREREEAEQARHLNLVRQLDRSLLGRVGADPALESAIANQELAFRMQRTVPELTDLRGESEATKKLYGIDSDFEPTSVYGTQCLLARRLVERGVRFVEITCT